jgi:hypothetical protein
MPVDNTRRYVPARWHRRSLRATGRVKAQIRGVLRVSQLGRLTNRCSRGPDHSDGVTQQSPDWRYRSHPGRSPLVGSVALSNRSDRRPQIFLSRSNSVTHKGDANTDETALFGRRRR